MTPHFAATAILCLPQALATGLGRPVKTCSSCRNVASHHTVSSRSACPIPTIPSTRSRSHSPGAIDQSSSTLAACSPCPSFSSSADTICAGPAFAPTASVITLSARIDGIDSHISRLEGTIHSSFATILTCIASLQSSSAPATEVISQVANDTLKPECLILLCNPESRISKETPAQAGLVFVDSQIRIAEESSEQRSSSFAKAIPNIRVLAQVWLIYTAIRVRSTQDLDLSDALLAYLEILIEFDQIYSWKGVTEYHLAICRQRFGTGVTHEWAHSNTTLQGCTLLTNIRTPTAPSSGPPGSKLGAKSSRPSRTTTNPPPVEICMPMSPATTGPGPAATLLPTPSSPGSCLVDPLHSASSPSNPGLVDTLLPASLSTGPGLANMLLVAPSSSGSGLVAPLWPTSSSFGSGLVGSESPATPLGSGLGDQRFSTSLPSTSCPPSTCSTVLAPSLEFFAPQGIANMSSDLASTLLVSLLTGPAPPARPNTTCELPIFDYSDTPATVGSLKLECWAPFLNLYPDQGFADQLWGALSHGTLLGYSGPLHDHARLVGSNLPMDLEDTLHLHREIASRVLEGRLQLVDDPGAARLVCSPVGVVPKPHSDKCHTIYHLSHPRQPGMRLPSVNDGIHPSFVSIRYETLDTIIDFVHDHQGASLWKADLEDAFRHIIIAENDARLLGFHFDGRYYQECALAFGGRSSPFLFNLFAKFLHWVTSFALQSASPSPTSHSEVSHYLDDFFGASDPTSNASTPIQALSIVAAALGFRLSHKKTVWSTTCLEILGIELDSVAQMASITDQRHQHILGLCQRIIDQGWASLLELQQITGHLQFVTRVAPHGRAFLRRIYDAVTSHHRAPFGRRISRATRDELIWWTSMLSAWDGMSLLQPSPLIIEHVWTDASKCSIGSHCGHMEHPTAVFSRELSWRHCQKDIRFLEALAVLEALQLFSPAWPGPRRVILYVDNENVEHGLQKGSIRDPMTQVLFREVFALCLQRHINLQVTSVRSAANTLADALSRRRFVLIQQEYPRAFSLLQFNSRATPPSPPAALLSPPSYLNKRPSVRGLAPETQVGLSRYSLGTININVMMTPRSGVSVDDDEVDGVGDEIGDVDDNEVDGVGDKVGGVNTSVQCVDLMLEVIPGPQWTTAFGSIYIRTANLLWAPSDVR
ncbi:hypothetical protein NDA17_005903 [Ustilago hordei]|nr:hypothetical protein NDA17_005903 [Ustilago hordei]